MAFSYLLRQTLKKLESRSNSQSVTRNAVTHEEHMIVLSAVLAGSLFRHVDTFQEQADIVRS